MKAMGFPSVSEENEELFQAIKRSPAFWAKLGSHPYWPARCVSKIEAQRFINHRKKANQICVKFYGSYDVGWVHPSSVVVFEEGVRKNFSKVAKVAKNIKFLKGVEEAERAWEDAKQMGGSGAMGGSSNMYMPSAYVDSMGMGMDNGTVGMCYVCHLSRNADDSFMCQKCGAGYHKQCLDVSDGTASASEMEQAEAMGDNTIYRCRLCSNTDLVPVAPTFRSPWSPQTEGKMPAQNDGVRVDGADDSSVVRAESDVQQVPKKRGRPSNKSKELAASSAHSDGRAGSVKRSSGGHHGHSNHHGGHGFHYGFSHHGHMDKRHKPGEMVGEWDGFGYGPAGGWAGSGSDEAEVVCFICKEPGYLIQCDSPACRKPYHKACLSLSAWGQEHYCPRHHCVVCRDETAQSKPQQQNGIAEGEGEKMVEDSPSGSGTTEATTNASSSVATAPSASGPSSASSAPSDQPLWQCTTCPVAYCPKHIPPSYVEDQQPRLGRSAGGASSRLHNMSDHPPMCSNCRNPTARIRLARVLEKSWSRIVSNYLALPFMRPFMNGVPRPKSVYEDESKEGPSHDISEPLIDLVTIIERVRDLKYEAVEEYLADLEVLLRQTIQLSGDKETTMLEAMETLLGNAKRFMEYSRQETQPAEAMIIDEKKRVSNPEVVEDVSDSTRWRAECQRSRPEIFLQEFCPSKSLEEWCEYIQKAPMLHIETQHALMNHDEEENAALERDDIARVIAQLRFEDRFPYKTTLLHRDHLEAVIDQQSALLRRALAQHSLLRKTLEEERRVVVEFSRTRKRPREETPVEVVGSSGSVGGGGQSHTPAIRRDDTEDEDEEHALDDDHHVVTLGDMHIVKELQLANMNLKARLESKTELLKQKETMLQASRKAYQLLQEQYAKLKEKADALGSRC